MHYIREKVIYDIVLENMRRVFYFVTAYEKEFAMFQLDAFTAQREKELTSKKQKLEKSKKRIKEIDTLIQKLYEDNANDKISDDRFATLSLSLEAEQKELKERVPTLEQELNSETSKIDSLQSFIMNVKKVTQPNELTPELVHEFIEKIVVSAPKKIKGKRYQQVDIYYNGVGIIKEPTAEEWEHNIEQKYLKEKTA